MAVILNVPAHCFKAKGLQALIRSDVSWVWPHSSHTEVCSQTSHTEILDETGFTWPFTDYTVMNYSFKPWGHNLQDLGNFSNKHTHRPKWIKVLKNGQQKSLYRGGLFSP